MFTAESLTKRFGRTLAVDDVSFTVLEGRVTGFLGPNGAGKSTTMRMMVGLDRPTSGRATFDGRTYAELKAPLREVGAMLEVGVANPALTARAQLRILAATHGIPRSRVDEVLAMAGIESAADRRMRGFSLGMGQRLGVAAALLGDPRILVLDEPVNGLDPDGVRWIRDLVRRLAADGRTVFLSSHLMSETAMIADDLVIMGRGRVIANASMREFVEQNSIAQVRVGTNDVLRLERLVAGTGARTSFAPDGALLVEGLDAEAIARIAQQDGQTLIELSRQQSSLEDAYVAFTERHVEYTTGQAA